MRRIRNWLLAAAVGLALLAPFGQAASADPGGVPSGGSRGGSCCTITTTSSPDDPGFGP